MPFFSTVAVTLAAVTSAQAPDSTWRDHLRAASAAIARGDTTGWRTHTLSLQRIVGTTPRIASGLATLSYALGDSTAGKLWRARFTAMTTALEPIDRSEVAFTLADADMIAEDLVYDAARQRVLVSSVRRGSILAIDARGTITTVVPPGGARNWGIFALGIDAARNTLWVTTAAFPGTAGYTPADSGKSALLAYDLVTGALRRRIEPPDPGVHALGDLTLGPNGTVYVADGFGGAVYALDPGTETLHPILPSGTLSSPQTPALSADGQRLFVADYTFGIAVVVLATGRWHWLTHSDELALTGIDGMYRVGTDLIVVQNGLEQNRILRLTIDASDQIVNATPIVRGGAGSDLNHGMMRGDELWFIARSGWNRVAADGTMTSATEGEQPAIRRVRIIR